MPDKRGGIVLLTRPEVDSRRVAGALWAEGIETLTWPLTRIVAEPGAAPVPPGTDGLVFTSQNAVQTFSAGPAQKRLRAWCVGDRTARAARDAGFADVVSAGGDLSDLVHLLAEQPALRLCYLRGRHVSADLPGLLAGTGHRVDSRVVYAAEPAGPPPPAVAGALRAGAIGTVALWSRRAASVLAGHLARNPDWPLDGMQAVAISDRAAAPLAGCGFARTLTAARPDGAAMLAAICAAVRQ